MKLFGNESPTFDAGDFFVEQNETNVEDKKSISSSADVEIHCKVHLGGEIIDKTSKQYKEMCMKYQDVFSVDSSDIDKTQLVTMNIDTGEISQKTYTLPLKHSAWIQKELE